jgi:hypothetical protein
METKVKFRADIAAIGENIWSNNAMEYETIEEVKQWLNDLSCRWFGYDMARIVTTDVPRNEYVKETDVLYQNFRKA